MARRILNTGKTEEEKRFETSIRPQLLKDYIGQQKAKNTLQIYIEAAKQR